MCSSEMGGSVATRDPLRNDRESQLRSALREQRRIPIR